jgi:hypothetical protein
MTFRIADTLQTALGRLANEAQKAAKLAAFDLQANPGHPGLQLHRVERARDPGFWTARASRDLRLVLHRRGEDTLLLWVGHHDEAYRWAEARRIEAHPATGAVQIVEVREAVEAAVPRRYAEAAEERREAGAPLLFGAENRRHAALLGCAAGLARHGARRHRGHGARHRGGRPPQEAGEALLVAATGGRPEPAAPATADAFAHPDALRRFRVIGDQAELTAALEAPWERWAVFLHPAQREFVDRDFNGPARVIGPAGTGKTVVALHRAVRLARAGGAVLLTTFNAPVAGMLRDKLRILVGGDEGLAGRITVRDMQDIGGRIFAGLWGSPAIADRQTVHASLDAARRAAGETTDPVFLQDEWRLVVDA